MTVKKLDDHIKKAFEDLGFSNEDVQNGCWLLERNGQKIAWICLHKFLERVAQVAGITFDEPKILNLSDKEIALWVNGHKGDFSAWAIGEVSPANCKNAYRWAMAEKRAKDRVILKLLGIAGDTYSEEEADDFKKVDEEFSKQAAAAKAANTKAVKQAVANDEEMPHRIYNTPLQERYELCLQWLKEQTPATYINAAKGKKDWCNDVARELREQNLTEQLDTFMDAFDKATSIDDNVNI